MTRGKPDMIRNDDLAKVQSSQLRAIAEMRSPSRQVVVVKVTPKSAAELQFEKSSSGRMRPVGFGLAERTSAPGSRGLDAVRRAMEKITGKPALNAFASSNAVVIEVDGDQLRQIAGMPEVQEIYPNDLKQG